MNGSWSGQISGFRFRSRRQQAPGGPQQGGEGITSRNAGSHLLGNVAVLGRSPLLSSWSIVEGQVDIVCRMSRLRTRYYRFPSSASSFPRFSHIRFLNFCLSLPLILFLYVFFKLKHLRYSQSLVPSCGPQHSSSPKARLPASHGSIKLYCLGGYQMR